MVALASYLPLSGNTFGVEGDGLIPRETALMEGWSWFHTDDIPCARLREDSGLTFISTLHFAPQTLPLRSWTTVTTQLDMDI